MGSAEEDSDDYSTLYRTDGFWYCKAYNVLNPFLHKIKQKAIEKVIRDMPLPDDLCDKISAVTERQSAADVLRANREVYDKIEHLSRSIQSELKERMRVLHDKRGNTFCVHSKDPYMNVINYFKALKGDKFLRHLTNDNLLLTDILPWLGLTDWGANTGGRELQLTTFKRKLTRFLTPNNGGIVTNPGKSQSQSPQLTLEQLREARKLFFEKSKEGGKKLNTKKNKKLRKRKSMKKSKRT